MPIDSELFVDDFPRIMDAQKQLQTDESNWLVDKVEQQQLFSTEKLGNDATQIIRLINMLRFFLHCFKKEWDSFGLAK